MSQLKVEQRKEAKRHVKETVRKEKAARAIYSAVGILLLVAVIGWAGYSVARSIANRVPTSYSYETADLTAISDYTNGLTE